MEETIAPVVADLGYELWHLELVGPASERVLRIYIDAPNGVGLEDCERVSNEVDAVLDVMQAQGGSTTDFSQLEVSSPGLDRPLATTAHFSRFIGETARVRLFAPVAGQRNWCGVIHAVGDDTVDLAVDDKIFRLAIGDIAKARLESTSRSER